VIQVETQPAVSRSRQLPGSSHAGRGRLEHLGPMIHELIAWDLVAQLDTGTFVLREDVQHRLGEVWALQSRAAPEVFIGRPCDRCGIVGVTRLVGESRLCTGCRESIDTSRSSANPPVAPSHGRGRRAGRKWHRTAG